MTIINNEKKPQKLDTFIARYSIFFLACSLLHQVVFCFINTNLFHISKGFIVAFEALLMLSVMLLFIQRINVKQLTLMIFVLANFATLVIFQESFDPKLIRNYFIPILAIWLGSQYNQRVPIDLLVKYIALAVIGFGLFEALFSNLFQTFFNVRQFHIALGRASEAAIGAWQGTLSLNGVRMGGRNTLAFILGDHRISSVFLESASMANFGVIIASWGLSKTNFKQLIMFLGIGLCMVFLADSRFGITIICALTLLRVFLPLNILKPIAYLMPIFIIALCFIVYINVYHGFTDDFKGRLGLTGFFLSHFKLSEFFGAYNVHYSGFVDSGYPFALHFYGMVLAAVLWISLCLLSMKSYEGEIFKALICIVVAANLAIGGDAIYALKLSGFMWFLVGVMKARQRY